MGKRFLEFIKDPENLFFVITILISSVVAVLGLIPGLVNIELLVATVLFVLSSLTTLLLKTHRTMLQVQSQLKHPNIDGIFQPFSMLHEEIVSSMQTADEIWLLTRTGRGWWKNYKSEIEYILRRKGKNRFLFLDPQNGALKMVANSARDEWDPTDSFSEYQNKAITFLNWLNDNGNNKTFTLKVIDHLPGWTLLMINPNKKSDKSIIYVELATYHTGSRSRPVLKVNPKSLEYYDRFVDEFEEMWKASKVWTKKETRKVLN